MRIVEARSPEQLADAATLYAEYASGLDVDLSVPAALFLERGLP